MYVNGAAPSDAEKQPVTLDGVSFAVRAEGARLKVETDLFDRLGRVATRCITTDVLGVAFEPEQRFEQPDGSPIVMDTDIRGDARSDTPMPGPWEHPGDMTFVWQM